MAPRSVLVRLSVGVLSLGLSGCFDEPPDRTNVVFADALEPGVFYQPFQNSKPDASSVDAGVSCAGGASLRYSVPTPGEPNAGAFNYAGGAYTSDQPRDLSRYNALTFWAKASRPVTVNSLGVGNDNTGTSRYQTEIAALPFDTTCAFYVVPLPAPGKLTAERGLLWLASDAKGTPPTGYRVWFDEVRYDTVDASAWNPRPVLAGGARTLGVAETFQVGGTAVTYTVSGRDLTMSVFPATFDWQSSNPAAARVSDAGLVTGVGAGDAVISATLGGQQVPQTWAVTVGAGLAPTAGPPAPTASAADVISLYSDAYPAHPVDKLAADWSNGCTGAPCTRWSELVLGGDHVMRYGELLYTAIEALGPNLVDATAMTHVHVDVWTRDATYFKLKLVDFGADAAFGGGDDKEHELTFDAGTNPALTTGQWVSLDVPLTSFTGLTTRAHLAQVVFSASNATVFVDNVYLHR